jgi:hypothetical protein
MTTLSLQHCECRLRSASLLVIFWLLGVVLVSASGLLAHGDGWLRLLMPALIVLPVTVFALVYRSSETFRSLVLAMDTGVLVMLHSWRMVGMGFLFLYAHNVLPGLFAWLAGVGDMLAAAGAMIIGTALLKGKTVSRQLRWRREYRCHGAVAAQPGTDGGCAAVHHYARGDLPAVARGERSRMRPAPACASYRAGALYKHDNFPAWSKSRLQGAPTGLSDCCRSASQARWLRRGKDRG